MTRVGFFDSGIGGTSILNAFKSLCPEVDTVYIADTENCPYGNKPKEKIIELSRRNVEKLLEKGCDIVVIACNTATAAAVDVLREEYPDVVFVGMEPAVKPAALNSKTGIIAVLATQGTFNGRLYQETSKRFAKDITLIATVADEFVELVEHGETSGKKVEEIVRRRVEPLVASGADHIVLGCTHFPHLKKVIEQVVAGRAEIVDPSYAVAKRIKALIADFQK
jgi:glutamate racemase